MVSFPCLVRSVSGLGEAGLYAWQAAREPAREPARFRVIDLAGRSTEETVGELVRACTVPVAGGQ